MACCVLPSSNAEAPLVKEEKEEVPPLDVLLLCEEEEEEEEPLSSETQAQATLRVPAARGA